jgi:hypothetical protein
LPKNDISKETLKNEMVRRKGKGKEDGKRNRCFGYQRRSKSGGCIIGC